MNNFTHGAKIQKNSSHGLCGELQITNRGDFFFSKNSRSNSVLKI